MYFEAQSITKNNIKARIQRLKALQNIPSFDPDFCIQDLQAKGGN
jgi:hypothetical protein